MSFIVTIPNQEIERWTAQANGQFGAFVSSWLWPHAIQAFAHQAYKWTPPNIGSLRITNQDVTPINLITQAKNGTLSPTDRWQLSQGFKFKVVKQGLYRKNPYFIKYFKGKTEAKKYCRIETRGLAKLSWFKGLYNQGMQSGEPGSGTLAWGIQAIPIRLEPQVATHINKNAENWRRARGRWAFRNQKNVWIAYVDWMISYVTYMDMDRVPNYGWGAAKRSMRNSLDRFNEVKNASYWTGKSALRK